MLRQFLICDIRTDFEVNPIRESPTHPATAGYPDTAWIELPKSQYVQDCFAMQKCPVAG
ncbi:hypothetical protein SAMN05660874_04374 [Saccharopolyspora flava]|uniref:Uncharacterized protein n=1 Tax=Saccharopolyspora flava TaxID=95161 RepID=A0A1I6TXA1_9PSEU|nr:hypothetical protein SAMN05660874_04374 [Saccharopolyspora flava]